MANVFRSVLAAASALLQSKSVTAGTSDTTVIPDSGYDGLSSVTVSPTPTETASATPSTTAQTITPSSGKHLSSVSISAIQTQTKSATPSTTAQTITPDSGKYLTSVSVGAISTQTKSVTPSTTSQTITPDSGKYLTSVSVGAISTETKTQAAGTSNIDVTPTSGKYLTKVTITPQQHSTTYTPATNKSNNDMGASHNYRYVNTSGMITPSGNKAISANGTGIDVASYSTVSVAVPDPTLSGDAAKANVLSGKTFYNTSTTKQTGTMANNGDGSATLNCGGSKVLSAGYYSGGTISANSLASQTGVDSGKTAIDASHVHSGYQGWVNGSKVSGTYTEPTISDITPSDSSPVRIYDGNIYRPNDDGYAIYSYTSVTPSDASPAHFHDEFVKFPSTGGYVIKSQPATLTPSDSSPVVISNGTIYKVNGSGYAIANSPTTLTPNDSNPPAIATGVIYKGGGAGFAVATKPTKTETTLWTNSSPTSTFDTQDVTLSQSIDNFDYIKIKFAMSTTYKTDAYCAECIYSKEDIRKTSTNTNGIQMGMCAKTSSSRYNARRISYVSDTKLNFSSALQMSGSTAVNTAVIPLSIVGIKYTGI